MRFGVVPTAATAPIFVATDSGAFASRGLNVSIEPLTDTGKVIVSVASGQLPMGIVTMGAATFNAFNRGTDIKLIASGAQEAVSHGAISPLIVRSDLYDSGQLRTVAQLKGHKVALNGKGISVEYSLYRLLGTANLKVSDVDTVILPWPDMPAALSNKAIDAGLIGHPIAEEAISKGFGKLVSDDFAPGSQAGVVIVNTKFSAQHPEAIAPFLEAYVKTIRQLNDGGLRKDDKALTILQKYTKVSPEVTLKGPDPHWPNDGKINRPSVEDQQKYYLDANELDYKQPLQLDRLIDEKALGEALQRLG